MPREIEPFRIGDIWHVLADISRSAGGPAVTVRRLVEQLENISGDTIRVIARDTFDGRAALSDWRTNPTLFRVLGPERLGYSPAMASALQETSARAIHLHGLWQGHAWASHRASKNKRIALILSPRGMLEPWALRQGRLQKAVANVFFQQAMLSHATCIVATSAMEAHSVRLAGVKAPVFIVPNGVDSPDENLVAQYRATRPDSPRIALFLSRIAPKKGVVELLTAWKAVKPAGWHLRIVGPSERGYADVVAQEISRLKLEPSVTLCGPAWDDEKLREYAAADLFVLPSHSENFGMAIAEALAVGVPVITTRATPWAEVESERCGWWIDTGVEPLVLALQAALALPRAELDAMGARGHNLVARRYTWMNVAMDMAKIYRWAIAGESEPVELRASN